MLVQSCIQMDNGVSRCPHASPCLRGFLRGSLASTAKVLYMYIIFGCLWDIGNGWLLDSLHICPDLWLCIQCHKWWLSHSCAATPAANGVYNQYLRMTVHKKTFIQSSLSMTNERAIHALVYGMPVLNMSAAYSSIGNIKVI